MLDTKIFPMELLFGVIKYDFCDQFLPSELG